MQTGGGKKSKNFSFAMIALMMVLILLTGCAAFFGEERKADDGTPKSKVAPTIIRSTGEKSKAIPFVYTTRRELSLTFNGMTDSDTMKKLLDEVDKHHLKATFFLPGMRVAEEPELAKEIVARGHDNARQRALPGDEPARVRCE